MYGTDGGTQMYGNMERLRRKMMWGGGYKGKMKGRNNKVFSLYRRGISSFFCPPEGTVFHTNSPDCDNTSQQ